MREIWRSVKGWPAYAVSNLGRVKRVAPHIKCPTGGNILHPRLTRKGYPVVVLTNGRAIRRQVSVHILVAEAFLGPRPDDRQVNHRDGVKTNNRAPNLEYVTGAENIRHAYALGLIKPHIGAANCQTRLNPTKVRAIRRARAKGATFSALGRQYGVSHNAIRLIEIGRSWAWVK